jgi:peptidylprolyl isomerase
MVDVMGEPPANPWVFFDMSIGGKPVGRIVFHLRQDLVPMASENFRSLCTGWKGKGIKGKPLHYKNSIFHRIIPDRLLSGGDVVNNNGTDGESIYGPTFEDENFILRHVGPGCLSTCNRGPDTNDSRFFLTLGKATYLDEKSVVFGYVIDGMDVIKTIEAVGTPHTGEPKQRVVVEDCGECTPWGAIKAGEICNRMAEDS